MYENVFYVIYNLYLILSIDLKIFGNFYYFYLVGFLGF